MKIKSKGIIDSQSNRDASAYDQLKAQLVIDKEDLDECVIRHPQLLTDVGEHYANAVSLRDEAKRLLDETDAELYLKYRRGEGGTELEIKSRITSNPKHKLRAEKLNALNSSVSRWYTLQEAFRARGYMIRELAGLYGSQYWAKGAVEGKGSKEMLAEKVRESMRPVKRRK